MTDALIAACCAAALTLIARSVLGLRRADGGTDPGDEARSVAFGLGGGLLALVTLGLFIALA
ncbi:hypothetical protein NPS70_03550 [Streptomyces sp. C10-9-1]|uniref:hypothetical protein n=1 Tax=unclassified Streptomyces TaxID=2593676 RepID=UPI002112DB84|nr:hypothetical protein [Streptomyces sp. C10-9-1]MCQ6552279.1 hypothetical protein [Streptomyces sp. C10-9-1]